MKITITVEDDNLNFIGRAETGSFEIALQKLDQLGDVYIKRMNMELDKADVAAESLSEEV